MLDDHVRCFVLNQVRIYYARTQPAAHCCFCRITVHWRRPIRNEYIALQSKLPVLLFAVAGLEPGRPVGRSRSTGLLALIGPARLGKTEVHVRRMPVSLTLTVLCLASVITIRHVTSVNALLTPLGSAPDKHQFGDKHLSFSFRYLNSLCACSASKFVPSTVSARATVATVPIVQ